MFSGDRLRIARHRRKLSGIRLADLAGVTPVTVSKIENGHQAEDYVIDRLIAALRFPREFFFLSSLSVIDADTVSFRSFKKMGALERDASLAAGSLGIALYDWIDARFHLPKPDLIDLSKERTRPESTARLLRQHWGLGERPIGNVLKLLESKGVRILSLSENTRNVDAYSFWRNERPYIFLNQAKTAERSIFDSAHELAHLVLHHHAGAKSEKDSESQADAFASAFLMPEGDIFSSAKTIRTTNQILTKKSRWKVSAMALAYRLHKLDLLSDWHHRSICIELGRMGYRTDEPVGIERETSILLAKVLSALWSKRLTKSDIARDLAVPLEEIEALIFGLAGPLQTPTRGGALSLASG